jgi:hypothetical protein
MAIKGSGHCGATPFTVAKRPIAGAYRVQVNAWLLEDFDLDAQPIEVVDGKTPW